MSTDSPDLVIAKRLLEHFKLRGFQLRRTASGADAPLVGHRLSDDWSDTILIEGFSRDCYAWRQRASPLIVPGDGLVEHQVEGSALTVLNEALTWERGTLHIAEEKTGRVPIDRARLVATGCASCLVAPPPAQLRRGGGATRTGGMR